jgi:hypothetical protein
MGICCYCIFLGGGGRRSACIRMPAINKLLHLTDAGLVSIPVISAKVESAIISLLELDSHSNVSS